MLTDSFKELMYQISKEKSVTTKTQKIWSNSLSFYLAVGDLQEMGLIEYNMIDNRSKSWVLTKKGKAVVLLHIEADKLEEKFNMVTKDE